MNQEWIDYYNIAILYRKTYGDLIVLNDYVYKDDNEKKYYLGQWINIQIKRLYILKKDKQNLLKTRLLNELDLVWRQTYHFNYEEYTRNFYLLYRYGFLDEHNINDLLNRGVLYKDDSGKIRRDHDYFEECVKKRM